MIWIMQSLLRLESARKVGLVSEVEHQRKLREVILAAAAFTAEDLAIKLEYLKGIGASYSPFLQILATHFAFLWGLQRSINKGKTAAQLTGYLLRWLPWLALVCSQILGLPALQYLICNPIGWTLLGFAVILSFLASTASRRFIARVSQVEPDPGLWLNLVAASIRQGVGINKCVAALRAVHGKPVSQLEREIRDAVTAGGSIATHLETTAESLREEAKATKELQVERLPMQLLLPLGLFLIPQFLLLLVAPMVLAAVAGAQTPLFS